MKTKLFIASISVMSALVSGCASKPTVSNNPDPVFVALNDTATSIKKELIIMNERQQLRNPNELESKNINAALAANLELFAFAGPIDGALAKVADVIGYKFKNYRSSSFPVTVMLDEKNVSVVDVLRAIGSQAGSDVNVVVSERFREIRLEDL